ncbi:MAG: threonine synthase [Oligoflexia bacterium]|nr:threonine synthase [Oligoflexia bacterium]
MKFYSTKNKNNRVSLKDAVLTGMPSDNGLYMPEAIPVVDSGIIKKLDSMSFQEISFEIAKKFFDKDIPVPILEEIVNDAINFDAPLVKLTDRLYVLELFHGPTLAFKDFGARFMSRVMAYFIRETSGSLNILVATSGDTGSAVANGFFRVPGINIIILYPSGKISSIQEQQIATLDENVIALEVDGTFDDCQRLVKKAFLDPELANVMKLSSANSINIARLIPQLFYYFRAYAQFVKNNGAAPVFSVPSGNFGNLTAGLLANKMGLPVSGFVASTNINSVVPEYLENGTYVPRKSVETISNAMDVGDPSNFARMLDIYDNDVNLMRKNIEGFSFTDEQTRRNISDVFKKYGYILDPHGSVACLGIEKYFNVRADGRGIFFATAHPSKFLDVVEPCINKKVEMPERLRSCMDRPKRSVKISSGYDYLRAFLLKRYG